MAIRNIVQIGDPVLRKRSFEVTDFGAKTHELLDDMKQTLIKSEGVGLAAVQVGVLRRIFILLIEGKYYECINPQIISQSGRKMENEACLSVKGKYGLVERPTSVVLKAQDRFGKEFTLKAKGFLAKAVCHEYDHLNGTLYVDKAIEVLED